jgi:hypothetical protein
MATLMLQGDADVRMVQALLGHASLDTTALYTHVAIQTLNEAHKKAPGATLGKPQACASKNAEGKVEAAELLAVLAGEQGEEVERSGADSSFDEEPASE